jgi:predicted Fe-Mo cluster-binding NifX family protein
MKIALAVKENKGLNSIVDEHFGSAQYFLLFDTETKELECVENPKFCGEGGCKSNFFDESHKIDAVITNCIGDGSRKKLTASNIRVYQALKETVQENLSLLNKDELKLFHIFDHCRTKKNKKEGGCHSGKL